MEEESNRPVIRIKADARAVEFLKRLRDDTAFRERLRDDPRDALAEYGVPPDEVPDEIALPDEEEIDALLTQASEPDVFGVVELPPEAWETLNDFLKPLAGAMPLVPADGGGHAG